MIIENIIYLLYIIYIDWMLFIFLKLFTYLLLFINFLFDYLEIGNHHLKPLQDQHIRQLNLRIH